MTMHKVRRSGNKKKYLVIINALVTHRSCPSSITPSVTLTSHVVTGSTVSTVPCTLLTTVDTVPPLATFYLQHTKMYKNFDLKINHFFFFNIKLYKRYIISRKLGVQQ